MELLSKVGIVIEPSDHPTGARVDEELVIDLGSEVKLYLGVEDGSRWVGELAEQVDRLRQG